jgi:hypothetical protein
MKLKLFGLVPLIVVAVPGLVRAGSIMSPWGAMNELGPWDSEDLVRQQYQQVQPHYPTRPKRTLRQRQEFSRPINHARVDIDARLPEVPVYIKRANGTVPYDIQIRALTPEYQAMSVIGYPTETTPSDSNRQLELNCEIESMRRWDRDRMRGWGVRVAATFVDGDTVKLLEKAKTLLMAHGVCYPLIEKRGQLATQGVYEYHAAFVSQFEDTDKTSLMMEIGTGMHFNTAGNGYFERPRVEMAFTAFDDKDEIRIRYK